MNEYYHAFKVGFNWWYVAVPLMFVLAVAFATLLYSPKVRKRDGRLRMRQNYKQITQLFVAVPATVVAIWMMVVESGAGLIQIFDNHLAPNDDGAWSLIAAAIVMAIVTMTLFALYYEAAFNLGREIKCRLYRKQIRVWELRSKIAPVPDQTLIELESRNWDE
jgi:ABC-type sugar transport system permease subunit